jgi:hypothetical protein
MVVLFLPLGWHTASQDFLGTPDAAATHVLSLHWYLVGAHMLLHTGCDTPELAASHRPPMH